MATIRDLTTELTTIAATDRIVVSDTSAAAGNQDRYLELADVGVPALASTWAATQTFQPTGANHAVIINIPSGATGSPLRIQDNSTDRVVLTATSLATLFDLLAFDAGADFGPMLRIGNNSNVSTSSPGTLACRRASGTSIYLFPDDSGVWRTTVNQPPTSAVYPSATVVGAQTSHIDYKDVVGAPISDAEALDSICLAAAQVARFVYKSGAFHGEEFSGIVLDGDSKHRYGMDADDDHKAGKALNAINAIGDLMKAVRELSSRFDSIEARLRDMEPPANGNG